MSNTTTINSPLPGIFYRKPSPESPPFVEPGDRVEKGQTIGLVEVMKTFHELRSTASGRLANFVVDNEEEISIGQAIAVVEPEPE